jgi:hypothetical protein
MLWYSMGLLHKHKRGTNGLVTSLDALTNESSQMSWYSCSLALIPGELVAALNKR